MFTDKYVIQESKILTRPGPKWKTARCGRQAYKIYLFAVTYWDYEKHLLIPWLTNMAKEKLHLYIAMAIVLRPEKGWSNKHIELAKAIKGIDFFEENHLSLGLSILKVLGTEK